MSDPRNQLQGMFDISNRYDTFGDVLTRMHVKGFRCHQDTIIDVESPITAFCGLNGTGKSTLLQLASAAYKSPITQTKPYYIKDFIVVGTLDPHPFKDDASVEYRFWQGNTSTKPLTLSRNSRTRRWQGYGRRPERSVFFAGIGLYLPKIEQRDFIVRNANQLVVSSSSAVNDRIKRWTCQVLGCSYDTIHSNQVSYSHRTGKVLQVERVGEKYSEAHMGYGEGRSQHLIAILETLPDQSLVLIEEPETSLHPGAQYQFGKYLMDVSKTKKHQIFLTTHSEHLLEALPSKSRVYLHKREAEIDVITGLTSSQAKSLMTDGHHKALCILVEDECAKAILTETIRRIDQGFLRSVGIYVGGDKQRLASTIRTLSDTGLLVAAVRDGDVEDSPRENIFKLPGTLPPEKEVFCSTAVKSYMSDEYDICLEDFSAAYLSGVNHHGWISKLSIHIAQDKAALMWEISKVYARGLSESEAASLIDLLKEAAGQS